MVTNERKEALKDDIGFFEWGHGGKKKKSRPIRSMDVVARGKYCSSWSESAKFPSLAADNLGT